MEAKMCLKRCGNCNEIFSAQLAGMMSVLCRPCAMDCEVAYLKILKFMREERNKGDRDFKVTDMDLIAEGANIPVVFVRVLYEEGRFDPDNKSSQQVERRNCKRCSILLKEMEKEFCISCSSNLSKAINENRSHAASPQIQKNDSAPSHSTTPKPHRSMGSDDDKDHRYGLRS